jgi:hypothetical protein
MFDNYDNKYVDFLTFQILVFTMVYSIVIPIANSCLDTRLQLINNKKLDIRVI